MNARTLEKCRAVLALLTVITGATMSSGCATGPYQSPYSTFQETYPRLYDERPVSILVLPAANESTAAEASVYMAATLAEPLTRAGYYVLPIALTTSVLQGYGIIDSSQLSAVPPSYFGERFGADAVLFVTIARWDTNYVVLGGSVSVGLQYRLVSVRSGQTLWDSTQQATINTGSNSGNLLADVIVTALQTSTQDYVPIARQLNGAAVSTLPAGPYSSQHLLDGERRLVQENSRPR